MSLLDQIERRFRHYALPHVTIGLIVLQVVAYFAAQGEMLKAPAGGGQALTVLDRIALVPNKVLEGQVWRLVTFVCEPPTMNMNTAKGARIMKNLGWILAAIAIAATAMPAARAANGPAKSKARAKDDDKTAGNPYQRLCKAYLDGDWENLDKELQPGKEPPGLTTEQRDELAAMRKAVAECRPAWWQSCKANAKVPIHPVVWGHKLDLTYEPGELGLKMAYTSDHIAITVSWLAANMDNREKWEHGFVQGDQSHFFALVHAGNCRDLDPDLAAVVDEPEREGQPGAGPLPVLSQRSDGILLRHSQGTAARHVDSSARRGRSIMRKKTPSAQGQRRDVPGRSSDRSREVSLASRAEGHCSGERGRELEDLYYDWVQKHAWTVPEDIALRKAIQKFAEANNDTRSLPKLQIVTLPNNLKISLDPAGDEKFRPLRDAWLKKTA